MLDHCVGEIVARLKSEGLYDDAVILFSTDLDDFLTAYPAAPAA